MAVRIVPLESDQAPEVVDVFRDSRLASMPWLPALHPPEEDRAFFRAAIANGDGLGARDDPDGVLIGFAITRPGWVDHLYVAAERRGQGVGGLLLAAVLAGQPGPVELWTFQRNHAARAFYARWGFVEVEATDGSGNEEREPDVRLRRP